MSVPSVKLDRGLHAMHLFYRVNRTNWSKLSRDESSMVCEKLTKLCALHSAVSHPQLRSYGNVGGKADLVFFLLASELQIITRMHRDLENCFPPGTLERVFSYVSITELSEYTTSDEDNQQMLIKEENLSPDSEEFKKRIAEIRDRLAKYEHYRLYPEMPDWEIMGFYPMSKRRVGNDNWYSQDFATRKRLMGGHARVGRKYSGRISQLITGSTGLDDWEWGVTLMAHQVDALRDIVYEMRFDEVTARFGDFGPFYVNLRLSPEDLWNHLHL